MNKRQAWNAVVMGLVLLGGGCATQKESHTSRTGVEQLLISSAIDQSLDQVDLKPLGRRRVFLETKYLDCVDKNYVIVSMHQRLLREGTVLADKPEESDVILEVVSGGVGTDGQEMFVGVPEIPLPPPSPISIPKMSVLTRKRLNGTAKLLVVGYETRSKRPVINSTTALARSDHNNWNVLGTGTFTTGTVPEQLAAATGEMDFNFISAKNVARKAIQPLVQPGTSEPEPSPSNEIRTVGHQ